MMINSSLRLSWLPIATVVTGLISLTVLVSRFESQVWACIFSVGWLSVGTLLILALHFLRTGLNPVDAMVSEYSDVPYFGNVMRAAFFSLGIGGINLAYSIHRYFGHGWLLLGFAALTTFLMGIFSMRTTTPHLIHTSTLVGSIHGFCAGSTFVLSAVSMVLFASAPPHALRCAFGWTRAVALEQFNITAIGLLIYIILGIAKWSIVLKDNAPQKMGVRELLAEDVRNSLRTTDGSGTETIGMRPRRSESVQKADQGGGLVERILIFLFIEWMLLLSVLIGVAPR